MKPAPEKNSHVRYKAFKFLILGSVVLLFKLRCQKEVLVKQDVLSKEKHHGRWTANESLEP